MMNSLEDILEMSSDNLTQKEKEELKNKLYDMIEKAETLEDFLEILEFLAEVLNIDLSLSDIKNLAKGI